MEIKNLGDINKNVFHLFIKCDYRRNLKSIINNKDFTYNIYVDRYKYIKIEEKCQYLLKLNILNIFKIS